MDDARTLVDLAQRFDIPSIIRNCVPWVSQNTTDLVLNAYAPHFDAIYWLNLAEAGGYRQLQVSCMAAIADEVAFYSVGEGEYWSSFDMARSQSISNKVLFIIARAVAEACSRCASCLQAHEPRRIQVHRPCRTRSAARAPVAHSSQRAAASLHRLFY
jgi:hypothetical protein